jgi:hypothetical protein
MCICVCLPQLYSDLRFERLGFELGSATGDREMALERCTPPTLSRRACNPRYALQRTNHCRLTTWAGWDGCVRAAPEKRASEGRSRYDKAREDAHGDTARTGGLLRQRQSVLRRGAAHGSYQEAVHAHAVALRGALRWVTLRARWVTLRARLVTLRARLVTLSARLVTLRARWVTLRARWVTLRARWVMLRARWVTLRARWVVLRARWVTLRAPWVTLRARWVMLRARWVMLRARWVMPRARWVMLRAPWVTL